MMNVTTHCMEDLLQDIGFQTRQLKLEDATNYVLRTINVLSYFTLLIYNHNHF